LELAFHGNFLSFSEVVTISLSAAAPFQGACTVPHLNFFEIALKYRPRGPLHVM
jgi:hypothetical protein